MLNLGKLVRIAGAFWALTNRHVTGLRGTALVVPSGEALAFISASVGCVFVLGTARMALGGSRYGAEPSTRAA